jgi:hypothetical protein
MLLGAALVLRRYVDSAGYRRIVSTSTAVRRERGG